MIINSGVGNISVPYNTACTYPPDNTNLSGISSVMGITNVSRIIYLPNGQYLIRGNTTQLTLPAIFTPSVINSIYNQWYMYYIYNDLTSQSNYNAAYIDASNNVYLCFTNNTYIYGMQFLAGSTSVNKTGLFPCVINSGSTTASSNQMFSNTHYAKYNNPVCNILLKTSSSGGTASAWFTLDGVSSNVVTTTSTSYVPLTCTLSVNDTNMTLHTFALFFGSSSSSYTTTGEFLSFGN